MSHWPQRNELKLKWMYLCVAIKYKNLYCITLSLINCLNHKEMAELQIAISLRSPEYYECNTFFSYSTSSIESTAIYKNENKISWEPFNFIKWRTLFLCRVKSTIREWAILTTNNSGTLMVGNSWFGKFVTCKAWCASLRVSIMENHLLPQPHHEQNWKELHWSCNKVYTTLDTAWIKKKLDFVWWYSDVPIPKSRPIQILNIWPILIQLVNYPDT